MTRMINSLPDWSKQQKAKLIIYDSTFGEKEQNRCLEKDVQTAKNKNWMVLDLCGDPNNMAEYKGYDTRIQGIEKESINLYPNPAKTHITLTLPDEACGQQIFISDLSGCVLMQFTAQTTTQTMDISSLPAGNYLLKTDRQAIRFTVVK